MQIVDILLVEGDATSQGSLAPLIEEHDYVVRICATVAEALALLAKVAARMVIVNWRSLSPTDRTLCVELNARLAGTAVVYAATRGVDSGPPAGSLMLNPPLTARKLLNQIRRYLPSKVKKEQELRAGDLSLNLDRRVVTVVRQSVAYLTPRQSGLLAALLRHTGELVTRRQLMLEVWETDFMDDTRTLDVHVRWLREAIELDPAHPQRLRTVRGEGYLLMPHTARE